MSPAKAFSRIITDDTLLENKQHGSKAFPFQFYYEDIWEFEFHCIDWHWHPELELVYVQSGQAVCNIGAETVTLDPGHALLINARVIHRFEAKEKTAIPNAVFSPTFLAAEDTGIYQKYVLPFLSCDTAFVSFDPVIPWQADCIRRMLELFSLHNTSDPSVLCTAARLLDFWDALYPHLSLCSRTQPKAGNRADEARVQMMLQLIHSQYRENLHLEDIARAVYVGKSTALRIFQQYIHLSPIAYLIQYRLKQAAALLG